MQSLEKSYKELHVLRGVDFEVASGSIFALLGSNGAGKTTIVRILSTLLRSDAGTATVNGFDVTTDPLRVRESISLTGQFAAVDEILSGRENLVLVAKLRHLNEVALDVVPVVFGTGKRYFGPLSTQVMLENPDDVVVGDRVLHLRFRVRR